MILYNIVHCYMIFYIHLYYSLLPLRCLIGSGWSWRRPLKSWTWNHACRLWKILESWQTLERRQWHRIHSKGLQGSWCSIAAGRWWCRLGYHFSHMLCGRLLWSLGDRLQMSREPPQGGIQSCAQKATYARCGLQAWEMPMGRPQACWASPRVCAYHGGRH